MVVVDASVVIAALIGHEAAGVRVLKSTDELHAPASIDAEVLHGLRRNLLAREITQETAAGAVLLLSTLPVTRHPVTPFVSRMWQLRHNITAYDAGYVALAESLDVPLLTRDKRLARASAHAARIEYIA